MSEPTTEARPMADTEFMFRVGLALGGALVPPAHATLPALEPGQRIVQMWSEPDSLGYRHLLTFEVKP